MDRGICAGSYVYGDCRLLSLHGRRQIFDWIKFSGSMKNKKIVKKMEIYNVRFPRPRLI